MPYLTLIKINLGCGGQILPLPWVNCDHYPMAGVDKLFDFGVDPWPFGPESVDEIAASHCLEHSRGLEHVMSEAYRVMVPGGRFTIVVPHVWSRFYVGDPTHVLPVTHETLMLFSREWCEKCQVEGFANTPLALRLGVDFKIRRTEMQVSEFWQKRLMNEDQSIKDPAEFEFVVRSYNNVIDAMVFTLERI